jgi:hypothetical protein
LPSASPIVTLTVLDGFFGLPGSPAENVSPWLWLCPDGPSPAQALAESSVTAISAIPLLVQLIISQSFASDAASYRVYSIIGRFGLS